MIDEALIHRLIRFGCVGGTASLVYAVLVWLLVSNGLTSPTTASIIAYLVAIPVSFLGQKFFTFRAKGKVKTEFGFFLANHAFGLLLSTGIMGMIQTAGLDIKLGIAIVVIAVPIVSYLFMNFLVFPARTRTG